MPGSYKQAQLKLYHGYGHTHDLVVYGHVLKHKIRVNTASNRFIPNIVSLFRLFQWRPFAAVLVRLHWRDQVLETRSEKDGFFKFEWASETSVSSGWHEVTAELLDEEKHIICTTKDRIYVPQTAQYAYISDIDDTVMVSHSATVFRRWRELLFRHPETRKIFSDTAHHYQLLAAAHNGEAGSNPFFYVSSSEWNLYDYLKSFFRHQQLPEGVFLLNQAKHWTALVRTGKTGHNGKLMRIVRILQVFPQQHFVLMGDNSQKDPAIYAAIAQRYPGKIRAIYIRNVRSDRKEEARQLLLAAEQSGVSVCIYDNSSEAIADSRHNGLI